jgi:hypothetical protein
MVVATFLVQRANGPHDVLPDGPSATCPSDRSSASVAIRRARGQDGGTMKIVNHLLLAVLCSLFAGTLLAADPEVTEWSETGFVDLFNGKDLTGWQTTGNWVVEDGVVTLHPREGEEGWQRYDAYLTTEKTYRNFVLEVEFSFEPEGNSGVFLRVGDLEDHVSSGLELQILDTHHLDKPGNHDCGGIIRATAPFTNAVKPAGEWNTYQIVMIDSHLVAFLNGELIQALDLARSAMGNRPMAGHISFQDEAKVVSYRSIRIKELR